MTVQSLLLYKIATLHWRAGSQVIRLCEEKYGITRREFRIMALLSQRGCLQSSEIAAASDLERTRASRVLVALHQKKIIQRAHASNDQRLVFYELSEKGQAIYQELMPQIERINKNILNVLSAEEADQLMQSLDKIIYNIQEDR